MTGKQNLGERKGRKKEESKTERGGRRDIHVYINRESEGRREKES